MDNTCYNCKKNYPGDYYTLYYGIPKGKSSSGNYQYTTVTTSYAIQELTQYYCDDCVKKKMRLALSGLLFIILAIISYTYFILIPAYKIMEGAEKALSAYEMKINSFIELNHVLIPMAIFAFPGLFIFLLVVTVLYGLRKRELMAVIMMLQNKKRLKKLYGDDILIRTPADYKTLKKSNLKTYGK